MARRRVTQLIDDLDGEVINNGSTVSFSVNGKAYEIDLSPRNAERLREALEPFISAARPIGNAPGTRRPRAATASHHTVADIRAWAAENGIELNPQGRIPSAVHEAFNARH
ncbi:histone-like nucleoid-structuring protein Lsr2 [Microbacterium trichothecenolyticum]|uniref:histone-like nucleoid-structuring protein Lsr2 n=1 Tax=Microbacterium trichothecenolyticum TaxID=69370 RepID=UPI0027D77B4F|nr:Lsr2 family protein [Microbacterium trichothecenolyticum]